MPVLGESVAKGMNHHRNTPEVQNIDTAQQTIPCISLLVLTAERLSARQLILRRISEIVCMYLCMYVSVTLRNPIISCAYHDRANVVSRAPV